MSFTNYLETATLGHIFGGAAYTAPTTLYVGLFTSTPTETGGGTEVTGGSYARVAWDPAQTAVVAGNPSVISNTVSLDFPLATGGGWGLITHIAIFDAATAGNMLHFGALDASKVVNNGDGFRLPANDLKITID